MVVALDVSASREQRQKLIDKYGVTGPRYTSYPTALSFDETVGEEEFKKAAQASNDELIPAPLSLYLHIPFCKTLCYYCGCHKKVTRNPQIVKDYLKALYAEIQLKGRLFDRDRTVNQLHLGGGTPTFLDAVQRAELITHLVRNFRLSCDADRDYSIEVDPRTLSPGELGPLAALGFNRISFGVQDLNPQVQKAVNREHSLQELCRLVLSSRDAGIEGVSIDLIYGLPFQTPESFRDTLDKILELGPDTLSVFNYAHLPNMFPAQRLIREEDLPSAPQRLVMFEETIARLEQAGYEYVGMDHFAMPDSHLQKARAEGTMYRCFQGYSSHRGADLIGFGVSAISQIADGYYQQTKDIRGYMNTVNAGRLPVTKGYLLTDDDRRRRAVIQALMCYGLIDKRVWQSEFEVKFDNYFEAELSNIRELENDGLIRNEPGRVQVTSSGKLFLRNIARCFDAVSPSLTNQGVKPSYSKTI